MQKLPLYIQATYPSETGAGLLIRTQYPLIVGKIIQYASYEEMMEQLNSGKVLLFSTIKGYNIAIVYQEILGKGRKFRSEQTGEIQNILEEMAYFYYSKIVNKPTVFKKYKRLVTY